MCAQRKLKLVCISVQFNQSIYCPHEETLHAWLSEMQPVKILIRLLECAGWSESSLGENARSIFSDVEVHIFTEQFDSCFSWIKANRYTVKGGNSVKIGLVPFWKGVCSKRKEFQGKNLLPLGANSFLLEQTSFQKGLGMQASKKEVTKVFSLVKTGGLSIKWIQSPEIITEKRYLLT